MTLPPASVEERVCVYTWSYLQRSGLLNDPKQQDGKPKRYIFTGEMESDEFYDCRYFVDDMALIVMKSKSQYNGFFFIGLYDANTLKLLAEHPLNYAFNTLQLLKKGG